MEPKTQMREVEKVTVLKSVLDASGVSADAFRSLTRKQPVFFARMAYAKIRRDMGVKVEQIGSEIGRNHSTVCYLVKHHHIDFRFTPVYRDMYRRAVAEIMQTV